jgi:hypothetical protein
LQKIRFERWEGRPCSRSGGGAWRASKLLPPPLWSCLTSTRECHARVKFSSAQLGYKRVREIGGWYERLGGGTKDWGVVLPTRTSSLRRVKSHYRVQSNLTEGHVLVCTQRVKQASIKLKPTRAYAYSLLAGCVFNQGVKSIHRKLLGCTPKRACNGYQMKKQTNAWQTWQK